MKKIKNLKKKVFGLTLVVGLLVLSIVGTTMAYFTDVDEKTNVFTSGDVDIKFDSEIFLNDKNTKVTAYPGMDIGTLAKVKNEGTESAYVGILITFNKAIDKAEDENDFDVTELFTGLSALGDNYDVNYVKGTDKTEIFVTYKNALAKEASVEFFSDIVIPLEWNNDNMKIFNDLTIKIAAYATQTYGFTGGARAALNEAFAEWN